MGTGIQICGLNGSGKSTLGRALSGKIGFRFIDNEDLYFPKDREEDPYANPRTKEETVQLLIKEVTVHPDFIFAAVKGDYGEEIIPLYDYVIVVEVPKGIRSRRIRERSYQKFGDKMLPGGDMYEREEAFFRMAESREENYVENWLQTLQCPVIRVDGTKPVFENVEYILGQMNF